MNDVVPSPTQGVSPHVMEAVIGAGDLSKLSVPERLAWTLKICESMGLNPLTRPIQWVALQGGKLTAYVTRDGTDQLRRLHNVSLQIMDQRIEQNTCSIHVRATMPSGRHDEDLGVTVLPPAGEARANSIMKAISKAKRRVTLSIVGLGWMSEEELDTLPDARRVAEDEPAQPAPPPPPRPAKRTVGEYLNDLAAEAAAITDAAAAAALINRNDVVAASTTLRDEAKERFEDILAPLWALRMANLEPEPPSVEGAR